MKKLKIVKSKDINGCTVACMATVMGVTYEDVDKDFLNDFSEDGLSFENVMNYMGDHGFSIIHKEIRNYNSVSFGKQEILKPFAPIHIVRLLPKYDAEYGHVIIMDGDGKLHCPSGGTEEEMLDAYCISNIAGFFKA